MTARLRESLQHSAIDPVELVKHLPVHLDQLVGEHFNALAGHRLSPAQF
jgi:hypothetical protein